MIDSGTVGIVEIDSLDNEAMTVTISHNRIGGVETGILVGITRDDILTIDGNTITDVDDGIAIAGGVTNSAVSVTNNDVTSAVDALRFVSGAVSDSDLDILDNLLNAGDDGVFFEGASQGWSVVDIVGTAISAGDNGVEFAGKVEDHAHVGGQDLQEGGKGSRQVKGDGLRGVVVGDGVLDRLAAGQVVAR